MGATYLGNGAREVIGLKKKEALAKQKDKEVQDLHVANHMSWTVQNKEDKDDIRALLKRKDLFDSTRKWLKELYLWLSLNKTRSLTPGRRKRLEKIIAGFKARDRLGTKQVTEEEFKRTNNKPIPFTEYYRKDKMPDWLKGEGNKLPPRPPYIKKEHE